MPRKKAPATPRRTAAPRRIGRPPTIGAAGETVLVAQRFPVALVKRIDAWAAAHGRVGRSEAMRRLVEDGLRLLEATEAALEAYKKQFN